MFLFLISRLNLILQPQTGVQDEPIQEDQQSKQTEDVRLRLQPSMLVHHSTTKSIANIDPKFFMFVTWLTSDKIFKTMY